MIIVEIGGLILIGYFALFGIVNRICKCIEHCATGKAVRAGIDANSKSGVVNKEAGNVEEVKKEN